MSQGRWLVTSVMTVLTIVGCGRSSEVSQEEERSLGAEDAAEIDSVLPLVRDSLANEYVTSLGRLMASQTTRANLEWRFQIVDSKDVNAFALPGGFIYVNRGVIEQADRMDELAGIIGHEIGHVVRRHSVKQMQQVKKGRLGLFLLCTLTRVCNRVGNRVAISVGADAAQAQYSQKDETEADSEGVANTVRAGIDPEGLPSFFQRMLDTQKQQPTAVEAFFSTHPTDQARIDATRKQIAGLRLDPTHPLERDAPQFHAIQTRVRGLPPPPTSNQNR